MNQQTKNILHSTTMTVVILFATAKLAAADLLFDAGQRAMLTVSLTVDGKVEKPQGHRNEVVKWSTSRTFEAKVEMTSDKAEKMSFSESFSGKGGSALAALEDIQKQATACGQDQACQMRIALQMMNSPALRGTTDAPLRYQAWRPAEKGARIDVSGSHTESLHTVFYTAARETTDCNMTAPKVSPELLKGDPASGEKWDARNKETLENSARSLIVEVDSVEKVGVLNIASLLSVGSGNIECVQNIGSGPETSNHSTTATLLPIGETKPPFRVQGTATGNDVIASGSGTLNITQELNNLGVGFAVNVKAPLQVTVKWELKKL